MPHRLLVLLSRSVPILSTAIIVFSALIAYLPHTGENRPVTDDFIPITGVVDSDPTVTESQINFRLRDIDGIDGKIFITVSNRPSNLFQRGDRVTVSGKISDGFGPYVGYMFRPSVLGVSKPDPPDPFLTTRDWFASLIKRHIPSPQSDLALGYLLGSNETLPTHLVEILSIVGLTHIVVASGYNLSVLTNSARKAFGRISRATALIMGIVLICCFIAITGLSPSMFRAGLVSILSLLTWYVGRSFHPGRILLLAAAITLVIDPLYILDIGWQLSFASFAGILLISPLATKYFYADAKPKLIPGVLIETLSATIMTLPLTIYYFGHISLLSVFANICILPTIPATMALTFLTGFFAWTPPLAGLLGSIANLILRYHIAVAEFFASLSWSIITVDPQNLFIALSILAASILLMIYLRLITRHKLHQPLLLVDATPILR